MTENRQQFQMVLVTGMSGAGRTSALKALEDLGFEAVDNLPLQLVHRLLPKPGEAGPRPLAIAIDTRTRDFDQGRFLKLSDDLRSGDPAVNLTVVFLDCADDALSRRFTETRRRHPLAEDRPVSDGIARERDLVAPLRERADFLIDTTNLSAHALKRILSQRFSGPETARLAVTIISFSYRKGLPREAYLVFDVRFLRNPHYISELKPKTGRDTEVRSYVTADPNYEQFIGTVRALLDLLLPNFQREGKSYLTIAIGCTGGHHRSVTVAEELALGFADKDISVVLRHREVDQPAHERLELKLGEAEKAV